MGRSRTVILLAYGAAIAALPCFTPLTHAEELIYKAENKWVAAEDNPPLLALLKAARTGKTRYVVQLPTEKRELAVSRLEVVRDLLAREAKTAVIIEEGNGSAKANTLIIQ